MTAARYETWHPQGKSADVVDAINDVCPQYRAAGLPLTVSQAFYQLTSTGALNCTSAARKRFGVITTRARLAGLVDWDLLADPTYRFHPAGRPAGTNRPDTQPSSQLSSRAPSDDDRAPPAGSKLVEVWTEKESLAGVVTAVTSRHHASWVSCRGLPSLTALQQAARRHAAAILAGTPVVVLLLADHDEQGRGIEGELGRRLHRMSATHWLDERLDLLRTTTPGRGLDLADVQAAIADSLEGRPGLQIERVALSDAQIERHRVPGNPDGPGHELEAVDPRWLVQTLDLAVSAHMNRQPVYASAWNEENIR